VKFADAVQHFVIVTMLKAGQGLETRQASTCSNQNMIHIEYEVTMKLITPPYFPHSIKGCVFQVGAHVPIVASHLWLSVQQSSNTLTA